jgi:hypothetical protein
MCFFSRLRASASTWSFQRGVIHSGLLGLAVAPDSAVPRFARADSIEPGRSVVFRPSVGRALDVDTSHLRSVVAEALIGTAMSKLRRTLGCHATHVSGCRKPAGAHMGIDPHSYRDRHPIQCEVQELSNGRKTWPARPTLAYDSASAARQHSNHPGLADPDAKLWLTLKSDSSVPPARPAALTQCIRREHRGEVQTLGDRYWRPEGQQRLGGAVDD